MTLPEAIVYSVAIIFGLPWAVAVLAVLGIVAFVAWIWVADWLERRNHG